MKLGQVIVFLLFSFLQVRLVDARDYTIPSESPKDCIKEKLTPCEIVTGDKPRMFSWDESVWELDRNIVLEKPPQATWNLYKGLLVVRSLKPLMIHTPFADVILGKSKVMLHVMDDRVRVLSLDGEGILVKQKGQSEENYLVPGFQNWYAGYFKGDWQSGVATVINVHEYGKLRSHFFMDHQFGFMKELEKTASIVKWAAELASRIHKDLVDRKVASLEDAHQQELLQKRRKSDYELFLRKLFLQKVRYDY